MIFISGHVCAAPRNRAARSDSPVRNGTYRAGRYQSGRPDPQGQTSSSVKKGGLDRPVENLQQGKWHDKSDLLVILRKDHISKAAEAHLRLITADMDQLDEAAATDSLPTHMSVRRKSVPATGIHCCLSLAHDRRQATI